MSNNLSIEPAAPKIKALARSAMVLHEYRQNTWSVVLPRGTTREMLVLAAPWTVVSDQFHPYDRVYALEESRAFYAELLVLDAGRGYCTMVELSYHPLPVLLVSEAGLPPGFDIFYAGPVENDNGGYCVKRLTDNVIMTSGHPNRESARAALLDSATLR